MRSSGRRITAVSLQGEYDIDDGYFSLLLELKSIRYRRGERLNAFDPSEYYSFSELRSLMEYKEPLAYRAVNWLIRAALYLPALVLPPAAYVLLLSALLRSSASAGAPLLLILSLPAMVFAMAASYQLCAAALLKMERTRYGLLRAYTLRHGGLRLALTMASAAKKLFALGAASAAALGLGIGLLFCFKIKGGAIPFGPSMARRFKPGTGRNGARRFFYCTDFGGKRQGSGDCGDGKYGCFLRSSAKPTSFLDEMPKSGISAPVKQGV